IIVFVAAVAAWGPTGGIFEGRASFDYLIFSALLVGTVGNVLLVWLALRPVHELQRVAKRVAQGRLEERALLSPLADQRLALLIGTTNQMLDKLAEDRR